MSTLMLTPVPRDRNQIALVNSSTELFTTRIVGAGTTLQNIALPIDFKWITIHIEGTTALVNIVGTATGSAQAVLTSDGYSMTFDNIAKEANAVLGQIAAASGTKNLSIFAGR